MPDELDVPEWVSEPPSSPSSVQDRGAARRADLRRAGREREDLQRERRRHHSDTRRPRRERRQALERDLRPLPGARRATRSVEMVPPGLLTDAADDVRADVAPEPVTRSRRRSSAHVQRPSRVRFARRRAAAALALTTGLALLLWSFWPSEGSSPPERGTADLRAAVAPRSDPTAVAEDPPTATVEVPLPGVTAVPRSGDGALTSVALPAIAAPKVNPHRTVRVGFQVESGSGVDAAQAATIISATLGDERGWQTRDQVRFRAVSPAAVAAGDVDITIVLASPNLTDDLCAPLRTRGEVSCFNLRKVVLNTRRWTAGVPGYGKDLAAYRQYMVNHEVGHGLYHGHVECPGKGTLAPIMLQQSKGLDGCRPNAWPTLR
ncbi:MULTISPECIES: DUF3152 domain-containing protein [unclassified Knoellia]|uniref:DUF3152 domain-containing protein n=1 Tax=Knoellia altitudinis TaxID=3404795 RepID=UPI00361A4097